MKEKEIDALFVNMLEEISWVLNVKAVGQHEFDPLFNSALLIVAGEEKDDTKLMLFLEDDKVGAAKQTWKMKVTTKYE